MDKEQIKILRSEFKKFLKSEEPFFEFSVGENLKFRNQVPFKVIFPGINRLMYYFRHILSRLIQFIDVSFLKVFVYRLLGFKIGKGVYIAPDVILDSQFPKLVEIGDYVVLGWGTKIFTHDYNGVYYRVGRVKIGMGTVVGGFSFIRAGVTIDEKAVVKLGSTIFQDTNSNIVRQEQIKESFENRKKDNF